MYSKDIFTHYDWTCQIFYFPNIAIPCCQDQAVVGGLIGDWVGCCSLSLHGKESIVKLNASS